MAAGGLYTSPSITLPTMFLFIYLLLSPLPVAGNSREKICDKQTPVNCTMHFAAFMTLPEDEKFTECLNASRGLQCLESFLSRCTHTADVDEDVDEDYYISFRQKIYEARRELQETCGVVSFLRGAGCGVLWTTLCAAVLVKTV